MAISKQAKRLILLFFISLLLDVVLSPLRGYAGFVVSSIVSFAAFFLLTWIFGRRWADIKPWKILLAVFLGWVPLNLSVRILSLEGTMVSLPDAVMHVFGMVGGYLFFIAGRTWRCVVVACGAALCMAVFPVYGAWLHHLGFGAVSGMAEPFEVPPLQVLDPAGEEFAPGGDGTVCVLDFWNIGCGACVDEFPEFEKLAREYSTREDFRLYAVGLRSRDESDEEMFGVFKQYYSVDFPVVVAPELDRNNIYGVKLFPTVIVIDGVGRMVYRGGVDGARKMLTEWR